MIDYEAIADRAVEIIGSTLVAPNGKPVAEEWRHLDAFDVMRVEMIDEPVAGAVYESEISLMSRLGVADADAILTKIEANVPARVQRLIQSERGINLADPQTQELVAQLVQGGALTQDESDALFAPLTTTRTRWPGLLPGYVQDALRKRAAGEV